MANNKTPIGGGGGGSPPIINVYPPGTALDTEAVKYSTDASGALSAHKFVIVTSSGLAYANKDTLSQQDKILGMTITSAAAAGDPVDVVTSGKVNDPSLSFIPGAVYLDTAGGYTQVRPTSGMWVVVGMAIDANTLDVNIQLPVVLA